MALTTPPAQAAQQRGLPSETYVPRAMPTCLGTFDLIAMYLVAIFFIGNAALGASAGVVSLTYLLIGALTFFLPCVIATAQLGVLWPHEGSLYNWTCRALGPRWGFFAGISYWLPNILAIVAAADAFITYVQGLNNAWLAAPWQQGVVLLLVIAFTSLLALSRMRTTQNIVNTVVVLLLGVVGLVFLACLISLVQNGSTTPLSHVDDWLPNGQNFPLFGLIALLYLGTSIPMNCAGEIRQAGRQKVITRHLLWGTVLVLVGYFGTAFALLVVRGPALAKASVLPYEVITEIGSVLGKFPAGIAAVCVLSVYLLSPMVYNYTTARLLLAASIDGRLPVFLGRLNKNRVPARAILFQASLAALFVIVIFFIAPAMTSVGDAANLATRVYNVVLAAMTTLWALSTLFFFANLIFARRRDPEAFERKRVFPRWVLGGSVLVGSVTCLVVVVDTFQNSWTPLISNSNWWIVVGLVTAMSIALAAIFSAFASAQVAWEDLSALSAEQRLSGAQAASGS